MACPFLSACLCLCEWTGCPGPDGSSRRVGSRRVGSRPSPSSSRCDGSHISVSTMVGLVWAGWPAPRALRVSDQSGRILDSYSMVAMEYDKGKISARGREISWLNHPCYLGYKGEVGYKYIYIYTCIAYVSCPHHPYIVYQLPDTHGEHEKMKSFIFIY